jgi:hypothetical protein
MPFWPSQNGAGKSHKRTQAQEMMRGFESQRTGFVFGRSQPHIGVPNAMDRSSALLLLLLHLAWADKDHGRAGMYAVFIYHLPII